MASITHSTRPARAQAPARELTDRLLREAHAAHAQGLGHGVEAALDRATAAALGDADACAALGDFCARIEQPARAFAAYDRALALRPEHAVLWFNRAAVRRFLGQLAEAEADYDRCIALNPGDAQAHLNRSELRVQTSERNHVDVIRARLEVRPLDWLSEVQLRYALAKELEDLGAYAEAWQQLEAGARLRRRHLKYDPRRDLETADWLMAAFPHGAPAHVGHSARAAIFILGMPRTGSTLVDRMLGSHTQVRSAGEMLHFGNAVVDAARTVLGAERGTGATRRALIAASAQADFAALGRDYMRRARAGAGDSPRFTDKLPLNYLYCAHIAAALPQAAMVHVTRHPLATCYGVYKVLFDQGYPFSYDLDEIADHYVAYRRLMDHWRATLGGRLLEVSYEDVVADPRGQCARMLASLDLPWEEACVAFHRNPAPATTASASQVRRPLYTDALHRWRHYADALAPVRRRLEAAGIDCA